MNVEDLDLKFAQKARENSAEFKRLCLLSLEWQAAHVNIEKLAECVNAEVFPPKQSFSFSRKMKGEK
jgi:hypothetical protein